MKTIVKNGKWNGIETATDRQYDVYYTDGVNETYTTLDAETAEEALKAEQIEIDSWNEKEGYEKYRITKVHYAIV